MSGRLKHRLDLVGNFERRLGLGFDLIDGDAVSEFDQGEAMCEVDVEDALDCGS